MDAAGKSCESLKNDSKPDEKDARQCNPSLPKEMECDVNKMRGDAIGNTLYSECWVLKVLLKLSRYNSEILPEDVETELCLLWDMTIEPDVVELLMEHNFLDLAYDVIKATTAPRLTEILMGILGNICCLPSVRKRLSLRRDLIRGLLGFLSLSDVPTLLQLVRLIQTCAWDLRNSKEQKAVKVDWFVAEGAAADLQKQSTSKISPKSQLAQKALEVTDNFWMRELMDISNWVPSIIFILNSSTNDKLLCSVLSLMDTLCYIPIDDRYLGNYIPGSALVMGLVETLDQLHKEYRYEDEYPSEKLHKAASHWISVLSSFTSFAEGRQALGNNARALNAVLGKHLAVEYLDDPLHKQQAQFIMSSITVIGALLLGAGYFHPKTFNQLLAILSLLSDKLYVQIPAEEDVREIEKEVRESLEQYFAAVVEWADEEMLMLMLRCCDFKNVALLMSIVKVNRIPEKLTVCKVAEVKPQKL